MVVMQDLATDGSALDVSAKGHMARRGVRDCARLAHRQRWAERSLIAGRLVTRRPPGLVMVFRAPPAVGAAAEKQ